MVTQSLLDNLRRKGDMPSSYHDTQKAGSGPETANLRDVHHVTLYEDDVSPSEIALILVHTFHLCMACAHLFGFFPWSIKNPGKGLSMAHFLLILHPLPPFLLFLQMGGGGCNPVTPYEPGEAILTMHDYILSILSFDPRTKSKPQECRYRKVSLETSPSGVKLGE